jgi:hypothetical protein
MATRDNARQMAQQAANRTGRPFCIQRARNGQWMYGPLGHYPADDHDKHECVKPGPRSERLYQLKHRLIGLVTDPNFCTSDHNAQRAHEVLCEYLGASKAVGLFNPQPRTHGSLLMTSHDLARLLLTLPELPIATVGTGSPYLISADLLSHGPLKVGVLGTYVGDHLVVGPMLEYTCNNKPNWFVKTILYPKA